MLCLKVKLILKCAALRLISEEPGYPADFGQINSSEDFMAIIVFFLTIIFEAVVVILKRPHGTFIQKQIFL